MLLYTATVSLVVVVAVVAQGPPGVPPRTAGGQPNQQQFQQPPPQQQQQQQFQQQPPQQQQQYQQQQGGHQQQGGQQQGGHHGHQGHGDGKQLKFASEIHNADHIMDHLQHTIKTKPKDQMTEEELEFHYFKLHDYDNNNKLDGVEIGKALTHFHDDDHEPKEGEHHDNAHSPPPPQASPPPPEGSNPGMETGGSVDGADAVGPDGTTPTPKPTVYSDDVIGNLIDAVLRTYDVNDDGYVEYFEYKKYKDDLPAQKVPEPAYDGQAHG